VCRNEEISTTTEAGQDVLSFIRSCGIRRHRLID
jgi:hypothetical protein